jgi:AraC-like DNA-binding protein
VSDLLSARIFFRSPVLTVRRVRCRSPRCGCTPEEHSHDHSIAFIRAGVFVQHVGKQRVVADPSRVVFFSPGLPYRVSHPADSGDECVVFAPAAGLVREAMQPHDRAAADVPAPTLPVGGVEADPRWFLLQSLLLRALVRDEVAPLAVEELACRMIGELLAAAYHDRTPQPTATQAAHRDLADAARVVLNGTYRQRLSLSDVATRVHSSPYHLCRVFRRATGLTLSRYVNRLRLREAAARVADDERDLTRIAISCGFYDHSHFTNAFRREFGVPPSAVGRRGLAQMSNAIQV